MVLEWRGIEKRAIGFDGPKIRVDFERLADAEQASLGAFFRRGVVEFGQTHGSEQRGVGFEGTLTSLVRKWIACFLYRDAAEQAAGEGKVVPKRIGHMAQDLFRLARDFHADAVARKQENFEIHRLFAVWAWAPTGSWPARRPITCSTNAMISSLRNPFLLSAIIVNW